MSEFILGFLIIAVAFIGLATSLFFKGQPLKGSCGGIANMKDGSSCEICGRTDPEQCNNQLNGPRQLQARISKNI